MRTNEKVERWQELYDQAKKGKLNLLEYLSRSEGSALFSTALSDLLVREASPELPDAWTQIYSMINISRRDLNFPSIRGVNPDLVPELGEFKSVSPAFTSITVTPQKFGMRIPFSREMAEDNEVDLLAWRTSEAGRAHRELQRREAMKALAVFSTGPSIPTAVVGIRDHGVRYPTVGYTNFLTATADSWEVRIARAMNSLMSQTITVADMTIQFPVTPNFIVAHPTHQQAIQKVLNASITVVGTGVGNASVNNGVNVAGTNIFRGVIPIQIFDPTLTTNQAFIGAAKRGLVFVRRTEPEIELFEDKLIDVDDMKTRERFLPAVVEERFICDLQITG